MADGNNATFQFNPHDIVTGNGICEETTRYANQRRYEEYRKLHRNNLSLPYIMNQNDTTIMNNLLDTRTAQYTATPNYNSHPIAANLQSIAYQRINNYSKHFKTCIDIGGTPLRTPKNHHLCVLISNAREEARYCNANVLCVDSSLSTIHSNARGANCIHGAEHCNVKAEYGYMVNVYDITLKTIVDIMNRHDIRVLDVWMFLPLILADINNTIDQTYYSCEINVDKNQDGYKRRTVSFALNDHSNIYRHDYDIWRSYLINTLIRGEQGAAIVIEHIEAFGTFTNVRFIKTWASEGVIERYFPLNKIMSEYVMQPSILAFIESGRWMSAKSKNQKTLQEIPRDDGTKSYYSKFSATNGMVYKKYYIVEESFVRHVLDYGVSLKKDNFNYETVAAYCNTKKSSIVYERQSKLVVIHKGLSAPINVYRQLCIDLFLQCCIDRYNRTQDISEGIDKIKSIKGFWSDITEKIAQWIFDKCHTRTNESKGFPLNYVHQQCVAISENQEFTGRILNLRPIYYKAIIYNNTYIVPVVKPQVLNPMSMTTTPTTLRPTVINNKDQPPESITIYGPTYVSEEQKEVQIQEIKEDDTSKISDITTTQQKEPAKLKGILKNSKPPHGKTVSVPGDGFCALHALAHYGLKDFVSIDKKTLDKGWLNEDQIISLCREKNVSVMIHKFGIPHMVYRCGDNQHININWVGDSDDNGHWEPIMCDCTTATATQAQSYIGKYRDIPEIENTLYVNCANENLTDGAGQALDFAHKFPNYADDVKKPVNRIYFKRYINNSKKTMHLALAVAHNMKHKNDISLMCAAYDEIISRIDGYCYNNGYTVYLPLIGTELFGGNVCCLKKRIAKMQCNVILCFLKTNHRDNYNEVKLCTHGGGDILAMLTCNGQIESKSMESPAYNQLIFDKQQDSMKSKIDDIMSTIAADETMNIIEMSGAPGNFKKYYPQIIAGHYTPGHPFHLAKPDFTYTDDMDFVKNLPTFGNKKARVHIINDNPITEDNIIGEAFKLQEMHKKYHVCTYTFKIISKGDTKCFNTLLDTGKYRKAQTSILAYRNHGSKTSSGEIYYLMTFDALDGKDIMNSDAELTTEWFKSPYNEADTINTYHLQTIVDQTSLKRQEGKLKPSTPFPVSRLQQINDELNTTNNDIETTNNGDKRDHDETSSDKAIDMDAPNHTKTPQTNNDNEPKANVEDIPYNNKTTEGNKENEVKSAKHDKQSTEGNIPEVKTNSKTKNYDGHNCEHEMKFLEPNALVKATVQRAQIQDQINKLCEDKCINEETIKELRAIKVPNEIGIACISNIGVGGAGKTMRVVCNTCKNCVLMISPYRQQKEEVNIVQGNGYCSTYVVALNNIGKNNVKYVLLDEVYAHNFTTVAIYKLLAEHRGSQIGFYGTGDEKQIHAIDWDGTLTKPQTEYLPGKTYNLITKRNPKSIVELCKTYIPGISTTKKCDYPIIYRGQEEFDKLIPNENKSLNEVVLCFTHKVLDLLKTKTRIPVMTVGMAHGKTFDVVHLFSTDIAKIHQADRVAQMYTAVSRVSRQLIVYGEKGDLDILTTLNGSALERGLDASDNMPIDGAVVVSEEIKIENFGNNTIKLRIPEITTQQITETLNDIYKAYNQLPPDVVDINDPKIPMIKTEHKFKCSMDFVTAETTTKDGKMLSQAGTFNRPYHNGACRKVIQTLIGRYSGRVQQQDLPKAYQDKFKKGLEKFLRKDYIKIAENNRPTRERLWWHCCAALKVLQSKFPSEYRAVINEGEDDWFSAITPEMIKEVDKEMAIKANNKLNFYEKSHIDINGDEDDKEEAYLAYKKLDKDAMLKRKAIIVHKFLGLVLDPTADANKYKDLETEFNDEHEYHMQVSFHMKTQPKEIRKEGFDTKDKNGQGVSAWTKMANIVAAGHVRFFDELLPKLIKDNVQLSYNKSDVELSYFFLQYHNQLNSRSVLKLLNDFSEFDCSQEKRGIEAIFEMYRICGMNKFTMDFMFRMRSQWTLTLKSTTKHIPIQAFLEGQWQQHSGQVHTLGSNTLYNMGAMGMCYDFTNMYFAAFKGDDSFICCDGYKAIKMDGIPLSDHARYKMKIETPIIAEYIANIVTPMGFVPDLLRRTSRITSKIYTCQDDWDKIKLSTADALQVLPESNLSIGLQWLHYYYLQNNIKITTEQLQDMYFYLKRLTTSDMSVLGETRTFYFLEEFNNSKFMSKCYM